MMSPQRAFDIGIRANEVTITSTVDYRDGDWVICNCYGQPITQFKSVYKALRWVKELEIIGR